MRDKTPTRPADAVRVLALVRENFSDHTGRAYVVGDGIADGDMLSKIIADGHGPAVIVLNPINAEPQSADPAPDDQGA